MTIEQPSYRVVQKLDGFEIREYAAHVVAEAKVSARARARGAHEVDQFGQVPAHRSGTTVQVHMREEQRLTIQRDAVRDPDVADLSAGTCAPGRLHHRLLRPDTLQHRFGTESVGQLLDACDTSVSSVRHDVGRAESRASFCREG
jgi:hypothetical protein